jgi:hypothetical protein
MSGSDINDFLFYGVRRLYTSACTTTPMRSELFKLGRRALGAGDQAGVCAKCAQALATACCQHLSVMRGGGMTTDDAQ